MNPEHIPTIVEKRTLPDGIRVFGVICAQCSDTAEDYIRCKYIDKAEPTEVQDRDYRCQIESR